MREAGIDIECVFTESGIASGTALVMIGDGGDNYLSVAPGANYRLTRAQIDHVRPWIARAAMLVLQCEIPADTLQYVIEVAAEHRRPIMLNLAPARPLPDACLQKLTYLIVNPRWLTAPPLRRSLDEDPEEHQPRAASHRDGVRKDPPVDLASDQLG